MMSNAQDNAALGVLVEPSEDSAPSFPSSRDFKEVRSNTLAREILYQFE